MARILVAGATGHLGRHIVSALKRRNHWVRALTRNPIRPLPAADEVSGGDLCRIASLHAPCGGIDIIISAAGSSVSPSLSKTEPDYETIDYWGHMNLLRVASLSGIKRFIYVSVFSTPALQRFEYVRAHTRFADALARSGLSYAVILPTGFFSTFDPVLNAAASGIAPLFGNGRALTNPIHEQDLAQLCVEAIEGGDREIPVGGPEILSRKQIFELAFKAAEKKTRLLKVPGAMVSAQSRVVSLFDKRLSQLTAFLQAASETDLVAPSYGSRRLEEYFAHKMGDVAQL